MKTIPVGTPSSWVLFFVLFSQCNSFLLINFLFCSKSIKIIIVKIKRLCAYRHCDILGNGRASKLVKQGISKHNAMNQYPTHIKTVDTANFRKIAMTGGLVATLSGLATRTNNRRTLSTSYTEHIRTLTYIASRKNAKQSVSTNRRW